MLSLSKKVKCKMIYNQINSRNRREINNVLRIFFRKLMLFSK